MKAILLINFGSPGKLEDCRTFYKNMFADKHILPLPSLLRKFIAHRIAKKSYQNSWEKYQLIGGSPMTQFMETLCSDLAQSYPSHEVAYACSYLPPYIDKTVNDLLTKGVDELLVLPLYPQYSDCTTGSAIDDVTKVLKRSGAKYRFINHFYSHPAYLDFFAEKLKNHEEKFKTQDATYIYTAHSVPMSLIKKGDPYEKHVIEFSELIAKRLGHDVNIGYQSKAGKGEWLGPATDRVIEKISQEKPKSKVVLVPVSFVSENLETKYDLDYYFIPYGKGKGLEMSRLKLGSATEFATTLCKIIDEQL